MKKLMGIIVVAVLLVGVGYYLKQDSTKSSDINNAAGTAKTVIVGDSILDLSGQGLTKAPEYIFARTSLTELNLSNNALTGSLQSQIGQLQNLKILNLSGNKFTGVPAEVGKLSQLEVLDLSNNQLTGLPLELGNLSHLKVLNLSGNSYSKSDLEKIKTKLPTTTIIKTSVQ